MNAPRILVAPTDFSEAGEPALRHAARLATDFSARLHLLHVAPLMDALPAYPMFGGPRSSKDVNEEIERRAIEDLQAAAAKLPIDEDQLQLEVRLASFPGPEIVAYAKEVEADMVILGTHGRRGFRRFLLGSVAEEVVRKAPCPVTTVPPGATTRTRPRRVMAAVDLGPLSRKVLETAEMFAKHGGDDHKVDIYVEHVVSPLALPGFYEYGVTLVDLPSAKEVHAKVRAKLEELVEGLTVETHLEIVDGVAYEQIVRRAEEKEVDLLVLGSKGRRGLPYALLGSVAEKVVRGANCPTLVVHPDEEGQAEDESNDPDEQVA